MVRCMKTLPDVEAMLAVKGTMAAGTQKMISITCMMNMTIWYFHNSGRDVPFLLLMKLWLRGKNKTIVRYSFKQIHLKPEIEMIIAGISEEF